MKKVIPIPRGIDISDVRLYFKSEIGYSMEDFDDKGRNAISSFLGHVTEIGYAYEDQRAVVIEKSNNSITVEFDDTFGNTKA